ncbi:MAG: 5'/3'-nucleotidase SurE, partial [Pseudorhodoplanes sp.]
TDNSGVSHSLSLNDPLRMREVGPRRFAVKGTPTDCVILAVRHILSDRKPDLVISGVNRGCNLAEDVIYSGTVAGAKEGTVLGIPSFALSQCFGPGSRENPRWDTGRVHAADLIRRVLAIGIPKDVLININFPDCQPTEVRGVSIASQGKRDVQMLKIDARVDGRGNPYYWLAYNRGPRPGPRSGTDLFAISENRISVTPLRLDQTDEPFMTTLAGTIK